MKKFILKSALILTLFVSILCTLAFVLFDEDDYLMEFPVKRQLVRDTPAPKIVFLGGSNVAFGLDSKTVSDSLHLPVVNSGLQAGLGLKFILDSCMPLLVEGDVLVVMPEYAHFADANGELTTIGSIPFFATPAEYATLNASQWKNVMAGFCRMALSSVENAVRSSFRGNESGVSYKFSLGGFNEWGDEQSHWTLKPAHDFRKSVVAEKKPLNPAFVSEFVAKVRNLEQRGVKVILLPPAIYEGKFELDSRFIGEVKAALAASGLPFQDDPGAYVYPADKMYDTVYHLNKSGVDIHTQRVIKALRRILS